MMIHGPGVHIVLIFKFVIVCYQMCIFLFIYHCLCDGFLSGLWSWSLKFGFHRHSWWGKRVFGFQWTKSFWSQSPKLLDVGSRAKKIRFLEPEIWVPAPQLCFLYCLCLLAESYKTLRQGFFKDNVRNLVWACRDPISLILGARRWYLWF